MDELIRATLLALVQGLTEFLPISSSAHLILPARLLGWPDQGLAFDVAVHLGSLLAVMLYFRNDLVALTRGCLAALGQRRVNQELQMVGLLAIGTLPVALAGLLLSGWVSSDLRSVPVIASTTIGFGLLLAVADRFSSASGTLNARTALVVGIAQILAIIPGTSRSGITMTAALFCGLDRHSAARFSFLLSIPVILAAALLTGLQIFRSPLEVHWQPLLLGIVVSAVAAYTTISLFLSWVERIGFMPFVIYRCLLGLLLLLIWL